MRTRAISLIELTVVLAILAVVAVVVIPRFTQAATPTDVGTRLRQDLQVLRVAIERYYQDHEAYPGQLCTGPHAAGTPEAFVAQLTQFTDEEGRVSATRDERYRFGPYLRDGVPPCPVQPRAGLSGLRIISGPASLSFDPEDLRAGWIYNPQTGHIGAHSNASDASGRSYLSY